MWVVPGPEVGGRRLELQSARAEPGTCEPALPGASSGVRSPSNDASNRSFHPSAPLSTYNPPVCVLESPYIPLKLQILHSDLLSSSAPPQQLALNQALSFVPQFSELLSPHTTLGSSISRACPSCPTSLNYNRSASQQLLDHAWR